VLQTALDLLDRGYQVHIITDGVSSRFLLARTYALKRMQKCGAYLTTAESVIFQLLMTAEHQNFKEVSTLIKKRPAPADPIWLANM